MVVPEPKEEHDGGPPLFLRPHNIIHTKVPALRYLVRIRLIEKILGLAHAADVLR